MVIIMVRVASLLKWLSPIRRNEPKVTVYLVDYSMPNEESLFLVERRSNGRIEKYWVGSKELYSRIKRLRFDFYGLLKDCGAIKTRIGYVIEDPSSLKQALSEWLKEWDEVDREMKYLITRPSDFHDYPEFMANIRKLGLPWPPKESWKNIRERVRIDFLPLKLPKSKYEALIQEAITGIEEDQEE